MDDNLFYMKVLCSSLQNRPTMHRNRGNIIEDIFLKTNIILGKQWSERTVALGNIVKLETKKNIYISLHFIFIRYSMFRQSITK